LLGTKKDYLAILKRLDRLDDFGRESTIFARFLRPILRQFANAFDMVKKGKTPDPDFWGKICHYKSGGSGPSYIGGWISAFCVWDGNGKWQGPKMDQIDQPLTASERIALDRDRFGPPSPLVLDGLRYPCIDTGAIPPGSCEVDIKLIDNGEEMDSMMIAGHVGNTVSASRPEGIMDTVQPQAEWFMFVKEKKPPLDYRAMFSY
jgi:hypothetical protein